MSKEDQFRFVSLLALELENGDIALPSLPDVVLKIRRALDSDTADFDQIIQAVSVDPVLTSRLFVFANSAYYNRANVELNTLDAAIGRLGIEVVRNTAMSLAMKQLYAAEKHSHAAKHLRAIWARGMKLSCMAFAVAAKKPDINAESAFLCGLMHEVGKLYIVTKAEEFPQILGNEKSFASMCDEWNSQISKSIIESWGFADEMAESADPERYLDGDTDSPPGLVDVVLVAKLLVDDGGDEGSNFDEVPSGAKLNIDKDTLPGILGIYREKLTSMQAALA
ncbi:MAG: HDOD domain-containing protein [Gammaproteobacteria bacterium]|nr:HDOD domain-containing protein [Gammaproteobacteria bacterium]